MSYRVTSQGPFAVTIVANASYQALRRNDRSAVRRSDILFTIDSKELVYEGSVALPEGSSFFIIENQTDGEVELHLECFKGG